jgi:hypothetical protein
MVKYTINVATVFVADFTISKYGRSKHYMVLTTHFSGAKNAIGNVFYSQVTLTVNACVQRILLIHISPSRCKKMAIFAQPFFLKGSCIKSKYLLKLTALEQISFVRDTETSWYL